MFCGETGRLIVIIGLILLIGSSLPAAGISQVSPPSAPQQNKLVVPLGWKVHKSGNDLIVIHPNEWQIQERKNGAFLAYRPGPRGIATALVMVEPIPKIEGQSMGVVQGLGQIFPDLFPAVTVSRARLVSQVPEVAVGQLQYTAGGQPFKGLVMCFKKDGRGVLYVMASNVSTWPQDEPVMREILSHFLYLTAAGPGGGSPSGPDLPQMVPWTDPKEGAFTCPVPQGWRVEGGMIRLAPLDAKADVLMTSPDSQILIRIGDSAVPSVYSLPSTMHQMTGFTEGSWYSPDGLHKMLVMRYLPGASFLTEFYLPQRVGRVSNVRIKEHPEISQQLQALHAPLVRVGGMTYRADAAEVTFDAQTDRGYRKGYAFVITSARMDNLGGSGGIWMLDYLAGSLAAPGLESMATAIGERIAAGFQWNPQWQQQMTRLAGNVSKITSQTHNEIMDMIHKGYTNRSQAMDRAHERWTRAFRGQVLIEDPNTQERFEVPTGSDYYWRVGAGNEFLGTQTHSPELPNYWLHQMRIID